MRVDVDRSLLVLSCMLACSCFLTACTEPCLSPLSPVASAGDPDIVDPPAVESPAGAPGVHPVLHVVVTPESRDTPYHRDAYRYPSSIEQRIIEAQGGHFSPYTLHCFLELGDTDIEHIVATSEAHDSGMATRSDEEKTRFAQDLDNLTTASPALNRHQKIGKDPAEWMPADNRCWYVGVWVEVKRKYQLSMDQAEVDAILPVFQECASFDLVVPRCANRPSS